MQKYYASAIDPVDTQVIDSGSERGNETDDMLTLRPCAAGAPSGAIIRCSSAECLRAIYIAN